MADGVRIGQAHIEILPEISGAALNRVKKQLQNHLQSVGRTVDAEFSRQQRAVTGRFNQQVRAMQKGHTKEIFAEHRAEMQSWQKLQKQRSAAYAEQARQAKAEQADQARRLAEIDRWHKQKQAIQRADIQETKKYVKAHTDSLDQMFRNAITKGLAGQAPTMLPPGRISPDLRLTDARSLGLVSPVMPRESGPGIIRSTTAAMRELLVQSGLTGTGIVRNFDQASRTLAQFSTRVGLASFQLQLLGGFATAFVTLPTSNFFSMLTKEGMAFAVNTDQAIASLRVMLEAGYDVEALIRRLQDLAIASPAFNADDVITYASRFVGSGLDIGRTEKLLQSMSNIFSTYGVTGPNAELALRGIAQVIQKNRLYAEELNQQIAEQIPIRQIMVDAMGITHEELAGRIQSGIDADEFVSIMIKAGLDPRYVEGAAQSVTTLGGAWQQFTERFRTQLGNAFLENKDEIIRALREIEPVVADFIGWFVKRIPEALRAIHRIIEVVKDLKAWFDNLTPAQQRAVQAMAAFAVAAGPAAVAVGIFGTAVSGALNTLSFFAKSLAFAGAAAGGIITIIAAVAVGLAALTVYLYRTDDAFRKNFLQALNMIKDFISIWIVPIIGELISGFKSIGNTLSSLGIEVKHLAWVIGALIVVALSPLILTLVLITAAVVTVAFVLRVLVTLFQALVYVTSIGVFVIEKLIQLLSKLPIIGDRYKGIADGINDFRVGMLNLIDLAEIWSRKTGDTTDVTDKWKNSLNGLDLTTTGLGNVFNLFNSEIDKTIDKQLTLEEALNNVRSAMDGQRDAARSAQDASDDWNKSLITLRDSIKNNKKTLDDKTAAGQANRDAMKRAVQASHEMMLQDIRSGTPMQKAIDRHRDRTKALKDEFGQNKETRREAQKLINLYGEVPPNIRTLLRTMGYKDVEKQMLELLAMQWAGKRGTSVREERVRIQRLDGIGAFASGGVVYGRGGTEADRILARLSRGEFVVNADSTSRVGLPALKYINEHGELPPWTHPQFAEGGQVWPYPINVKQFEIPELIGGSGNAGALGVARMMQILRQRFPGLALLSGYRPGAITSTGNRSYHALGRAVDIPPRWDVFNWISANYGKGTKELIFTPAGGRQIKNGRFHRFTGGTIARDHYDHIHWAYDNGGYIPPNVPFVNTSRTAELALNASQGAALEEKIANSDRPLYISVYVDGVRRDAEVVVDEKFDEIVRVLGGS